MSSWAPDLACIDQNGSAAAQSALTAANHSSTTTCALCGNSLAMAPSDPAHFRSTEHNADSFATMVCCSRGH